MKKEFIFNLLLTIIFFLTHMYAWSMEKKDLSSGYELSRGGYNGSFLHYLRKQYFELLHASELATIYNRSNKLLTLPDKIFNNIIFIQQPLKDTIKTSFALRKTCKRLNECITPAMIIEVCKNYSSVEKNKALKKLARSIDNINYWSRRRAVSLLIHAGADHTVCKRSPLLHRAVVHDDKEMVTILFKHGADSNQHFVFEPIIFYARSVDIAEKFINHGVDLYAKNTLLPNVLWANILYHPSSAIIALFLDHRVDARATDENGCSILEFLINCEYRPIRNRAEYIKIATLLLNAAPDMINKLNKVGITPLDKAYEVQQQIKNNWYEFNKMKLLVELIKLFKQHGAKTSLELKQEQSNIIC